MLLGCHCVTGCLLATHASLAGWSCRRSTPDKDRFHSLVLRAVRVERSAPVTRSAAAEPAATLPSVVGTTTPPRRGPASRGSRGSRNASNVGSVASSVASGSDNNTTDDDSDDNDSNAFSDSDGEPTGMASLGDEGSPVHNQDDVAGTPGEHRRLAQPAGGNVDADTARDTVAGAGSVLDVPVRANCQILRSVSRWSAGSKVETSIHAAYCQNIKQARRWIYIENQFFVSGQSHDPRLGNRVAAALAARIIRAHKAGERFRVMVVMPLLPCFEGELASGTCPSLLPVVYWQMYSICR